MELNQNILIGSRDFVAGGTCLTPDLFHLKFPPSNYKSRKTWLFSRFAANDVASTYTEEDLGSTRAFNVFAVCKHNLGSLAKWRIRVANTQAELTSGPVYDSGWLDMVSGDLPGDLPWGEFEWGSQSAFENTIGMNRHAYHPTPDTVFGRFVRFDFDDSEQVEQREDNYLQFARLWASSAYQPSLNMLYGAEIRLIDATAESQSESMVDHFSENEIKIRELVANFNDLKKAELMRNVFGTLFVNGGKKAELIVLMAPLEPSNYPYEAMYCHLVDTDKATYAFHDRMNSTLHVRELK